MIRKTKQKDEKKGAGSKVIYPKKDMGMCSNWTALFKYFFWMFLFEKPLNYDVQKSTASAFCR